MSLDNYVNTKSILQNNIKLIFIKCNYYKNYIVTCYII